MRPVANIRRKRRNTADVEQKLWLRLRGPQFAHVQFHRQYPIMTEDNRGYVVDFACVDAAVVIEIDPDADGSHHLMQSGQAKMAAERLEVLSAAGWRVIRLSVDEVRNNFEGCLMRIQMTLAARL